MKLGLWIQTLSSFLLYQVTSETNHFLFPTMYIFHFDIGIVYTTLVDTEVLL